MLNKKTIMDIDVRDKKVLVRVDFNVPLDKETKSIITNDKRIVESIPTIEYLTSQNAKVILCSHIGKTKEKLTLEPVAKRLSSLLKRDVVFVDETVGEKVDKVVSKMLPGQVVLLENTRMTEKEEANDAAFAKELASVADIFVNDAFGTAHRAHASTEGVTHYLPSVAGFLIEKELNALDKGINAPKRPLVAIIGGAKVSSKIDVLKELIKKVDSMLIGGGMAYTFIKALGGSVGSSLVEEDKIDVAREIIEMARMREVNLVLPVDSLVANSFSNEADVKVVDSGKIEDGWQGLDIGPDSINMFKTQIRQAGTVVWNGPVGVFEFPKFASGTNEVASCIAASDCISIIGGGDSASAIEACGLSSKMTHVSTGGGASLELMEGKALPGIVALMDK